MSNMVGECINDRQYFNDLCKRAKKENSIHFVEANEENYASLEAIIYDDDFTFSDYKGKRIKISTDENEEDAIYKYRPYLEVLSYIEKKTLKILSEKSKLIVIIDFEGSSDIENCISKYHLNSKQNLFVNMCYSKKDFIESDTEIGQLMLYLFSQIDEKKVFIDSILKKEKVAIGGFTYLSDYIEIDENARKALISELSEQNCFNTIFLYVEPNIDSQLLSYYKMCDLMILAGSANKVRRVAAGLEKTDSSKKIVPIITKDKFVKAPSNCFKECSSLKANQLKERLDEIIG